MKPCVLVLLCLILVGCSPSLRADARTGPLVIVLLPGTTLSDWQQADAPALHRVLATGAVAVMNTRTARLPNDHTRETPESAVLTLGAGSRAAGGVEITDFHSASSPVPGMAINYGALYTRRVGRVSSSTSSVNVQWPKVRHENAAQGYDLLPGNLGDGLRQHNIALTAGGGSLAGALACNSDGSITKIINTPDFPHPLPLCLVWDAGADIAAADALIAQASVQVSTQQGRLVIVSPCVSDTAYAKGERLAPIVIWGPSVPAGLLYSPSTHQPGLVANTDFAPSITAYFGATAPDTWLPSPAFGHAWELRPSTDAVAKTGHLETTAYRQSQGMRILPGIAILLGVLVLVGLPQFRTGGLLTVTNVLPALIIFSLLVSPTPITAAFWLGALCAASWLLLRHQESRHLNGWVAALTVIVLVGDAVFGGSLMRTSLLGYSAVEGARYYGIGNEAMGVLVGSALVAAMAFWPTNGTGRLGIVGGLLLTALLLGLPTVGAKAGGLLVAVGSFAVFLWTAWGRRWRCRVILGIMACMGLGLATVSVWDGQHRTQSHMGQAVQRIHTGGPKEAVDIVVRKINVERRLLYHSAWAVPLWVSILGLVLAIASRQKTRDDQYRALHYGGISAMILCLALNDAGVVAAALCGVIVLGGPLAKKPMSAAEEQHNMGLSDAPE